ncbi:MAG: hypothetical protein D6811_14020 [Alphaproteobacteria bacterium]|nr:MAG: hypothetical protein D6811_14020 [Alphaproteobacteria bacterium]
MRILTRRMAREGWRVSRPVFSFDARGVGHAVYAVDTGARHYSLVAFGHDLPPERRSDRVIATAWDATFTLFDGIPDAEDIARLARNVPLQEAGRLDARSLCLSRANRSAQLWEEVVAALAAGRQPDPAAVARVGYLMRTTAVYGSGKFGAADFETIAERPEMQAPFQAEMLTVWLIRVFQRDLVNHLARARGGGNAVALDAGIARGLGIGNSTGLGLGPFIINHPLLFNNWIAAREEAIARVAALPRAGDSEAALFRALLPRCETLLARWHSEHPLQLAKLAALKADLARLNAHVGASGLSSPNPWHRLIAWSQTALSLEGQELLASLILEPHGALVDDLAEAMGEHDADARRIDGAMTVAEARALIARTYRWALAIDWNDPAACARIWYVSAEKLEPRLGERHEEPLAAYELPLAPGRDAAAAHAALAAWPDEAPLAEFLLRAPSHRHIIRRAQIAARAPYAEIRDNTIAAGMLPIDLLRAKLAFFGATQFDPRSDRWLRICMYAGAPYPEDLARSDADLWVYPEARP